LAEKYLDCALEIGDTCYIAGINGENTTRIITLNVPFINTRSKVIIITDSENAKDFIKREINFSTPVNITMHPYGGFVIKTPLKREKSNSHQ
jgi:type IV secretory pathway ATPase VirB11/archaellum biosynthesis ATPase